jgi:hypothetical protein
LLFGCRIAVGDMAPGVSDVGNHSPIRQVAKPAGETKILKKGGETWRKPEKEGEILGRTWRFL